MWSAAAALRRATVRDGAATTARSMLRTATLSAARLEAATLSTATLEAATLSTAATLSATTLSATTLKAAMVKAARVEIMQRRLITTLPTLEATMLSTATLKATTLSATTLSATTLKAASTLSAPTVSAPTVSAPTMAASTLKTSSAVVEARRTLRTTATKVRRPVLAEEEGKAKAGAAVAATGMDVTGGDPHRAGMCSGCGARLQTEHPRQPGYLPPPRPQRVRAAAAVPAADEDDDADLDWESGDVETVSGKPGRRGRGRPDGAPESDDPEAEAEATTVCRRCHSLTHYGRVEALDIAPTVFRQQLLQLRARPALLVLVVDVVDVPGSVLPDVERLLAPESDVLVVGHKVDLLPRDAPRERVRNWLARQVRERLPADRPLAGVHLASAESGEGVAELLELIQRKQADRDVVLVGCANVGKSRLINALLDRMGAKIRTRATTSFLPGTTLATVRFPLPGGRFLTDSPGVLAADQLATRLTPRELQLVQAAKAMKPVTYVLSPGRSLLLGGLGRLDLLDATSRILATVSVGPRLPVHVTRTDRVETLYATHWGGTLLRPPVIDASVAATAPPSTDADAPWFRGPDRLAMLRPRDADAVAIDVDAEDGVTLRRDVTAWPAPSAATAASAVAALAVPDRHARSFVDIVFPGLGWIALTGTPDLRAALRAVTSPGLRITLRDPLLPFEVQKRGARERGAARARYY